MPQKDYIVLTGLRVPCIIGIFDWERKRKQEVVIDLRFSCDTQKASQRDFIGDAVNYKDIAKIAISFVGKSKFQLIETLAERLGDLLLIKFHLGEIDLTVSKPGAVRGSQNVGVHIHRVSGGEANRGTAFLSLGSNIKPRQNLETALSEIQARYSIVGLSHVYETSPVGYTKQAHFWNLVVAVQPLQNLSSFRKWMSTLEKKSGRIRLSNSFGPRTLDVDLILVQGATGRNKSFPPAHPDIETKAFVLFPLLEIAPNFIHPSLGIPLIELAAKFKNSSQKIRQLPSETLVGFSPQELRI